jgi:small-conductance mechanosensitive channel
MVKGINSLFKTNLLTSLADSGEGTIYLTSPQMSADILPVEFVLQKGTGEGDGQVTPDAVKEAEEVACSEYHSDILQDEAIRRALNTAIQQATWEYKAEQSK